MDQQWRNQPELNGTSSTRGGDDNSRDGDDHSGHFGSESGNGSTSASPNITGNESEDEEEVRGIMSALDTKEKPRRISFYANGEGEAADRNTKIDDVDNNEKKGCDLKASRVGACHVTGGQQVSQRKKKSNLEVPYGEYWEEGGEGEQDDQQQQSEKEVSLGAFPASPSDSSNPLEEIMPFPESSNHQRQSRPGSFAVEGIDADATTGSESDGAPSSATDPQLPTETMSPNDDVVAVAEVVNEEDEEEGGSGYLPRAQGLGDEEIDANINREVARRENKHQLLRTALGMVLIGFFAIIAVVVVFWVILVNNKDNNNTNNNNLDDTFSNNNTSNTITTITGEGTTTNNLGVHQATSIPISHDREYVLSVLPNISVRAIEEDPNSPQAKAFEWLVEDIKIQQQQQQEQEQEQRITTGGILQRFALTTLYYATGGEQWRNNENWVKHNISECDWYSKVSEPLFRARKMCNSYGHIEHLGLKRNNLINSLPPEVFLLLTNLKALHLGLNRLEGRIPTLIGKLSSLGGLWLSSIRNGGVLPTQIGLMTNLIRISLADNQHTGTLPTELSRLTNMISMSIGQNPQLMGPIPDISQMSGLSTFSVERTGLTGTIATEIGQLSKLRYLVAGGNSLHGSLPSQLGLLPKIKIMSVYGNRMTGTIPTQLGGMTKLSLMSLRDNLFEGTLPSELGQLTNLEVALNLKDNPYISGTIPTELGSLSDCYYLTLGNNNLSGGIPSQLGLLRKLGKLSLENNPLLTGTVPTTLESLHRSLYYFDVSGNPLLSGTIPGALCNIGGTCIPHIAREACPTGGNPQQHMAFDCTNLLSGCGCSGVNSSSVGGGI